MSIVKAPPRGKIEWPTRHGNHSPKHGYIAPDITDRPLLAVVGDNWTDITAEHIVVNRTHTVAEDDAKFRPARQQRTGKKKRRLNAPTSGKNVLCPTCFEFASCAGKCACNWEQNVAPAAVRSDRVYRPVVKQGPRPVREPIR